MVKGLRGHTYTKKKKKKQHNMWSSFQFFVGLSTDICKQRKIKTITHINPILNYTQDDSAYSRNNVINTISIVILISGLPTRLKLSTVIWLLSLFHTLTKLLKKQLPISCRSFWISRGKLSAEKISLICFSPNPYHHNQSWMAIKSKLQTFFAPEIKN